MKLQSSVCFPLTIRLGGNPVPEAIGAYKDTTADSKTRKIRPMEQVIDFGAAYAQNLGRFRNGVGQLLHSFTPSFHNCISQACIDIIF